MRFVAFDLETTGTLPGVDRIVEIGAVRMVNGEVDAVFSTLVDPLIPIPAGASRVNGISDEMVAGKPKVEELLGALTEFCGDDLMVAHNAAFDIGVLRAGLAAHGRAVPRFRYLCTRDVARAAWPGEASYGLAAMAGKIGLAFGHHRPGGRGETACAAGAGAGGR